MNYSYRGELTKDFEYALSRYTDTFVLAVNTGTIALYLAYLYSGIKKDYEILCPAYTFIATINALKYTGAIPHFYDIDKNLKINKTKLQRYLESIIQIKNKKCYNKNTGRRIFGIVAAHLFGYTAFDNDILDLIRSYDLVLIEDACQSMGSYYGVKHLGTFGKCGALSFNGNKIITTGQGGAFITNNFNLYKQAKHLSMTAKVEGCTRNFHDRIGFNYRMSSWNALLGLREINKLPARIKRNKKEYLKNSKKYNIIKGDDNCNMNYWKQPYLSDQGNTWYLASDTPMYKECPKMDLTISKILSKRVKI